MHPPESKWVGGLAHWVEGDRAYISCAFTYKLPEPATMLHKDCSYDPSRACG